MHRPVQRRFPLQCSARSRSRFSRRRSGFTLVELLAVVVVIAILVGMLMPALSGVSYNARVTQVQSEIRAMESAIAQFQKDFNMSPPSRIRLYEQGTGWNNTDAVTVRSRNLIRQMWPQFNFAMNRDINGDGDADDVFDLYGAECLVFFLGGIASGPNQPDLTGFSKNPLDPFARGGSRQASYFEFLPSRLLPSSDPAYSVFYAYVDPLPSQQSPYLYLSSYNGQGYRTEDINSGSGFLDAYRQSVQASGGPVPQAWNATKYQIISPGRDGQYGPGGPFLATQQAAGRFPLWGSVTSRMAEEDNITNFHSGLLSKN